MDNFYGNHWKWWVGVVKEVVDETYVKVRIFGIHPIDESQLDSSDLPLALVTYPTSGSQMGFGNVSHNLEEGAWVYGFSPDESFMQPIVIGVIQGTTGSMSRSPSNGGRFVGQDENVDDETYPDTNTGETRSIPGGSNIEKTYNYVAQKLKEEGSSNDIHMHTSALVGVLLLETTNINPASVNSIGAWGICQWLGKDRKLVLFKKYGRTKRLDDQLDFMWWELNNNERKAKAKWLNATNLHDATVGFATFERAEEFQNGKINVRHPNFKKRLRFAYQIYNSMKKTEAGNPAPINNFATGV